jgi:hypothetical protein
MCCSRNGPHPCPGAKGILPQASETVAPIPRGNRVRNARSAKTPCQTPYQQGVSPPRQRMGPQKGVDAWRQSGHPVTPGAERWCADFGWAQHMTRCPDFAGHDTECFTYCWAGLNARADHLTPFAPGPRWSRRYNRGPRLGRCRAANRRRLPRPRRRGRV